MHKILNAGRYLWRFGCWVIRRYWQDRCYRVAGSLCYTTLLALVPLSAVLFAILSIVPAFQAWMTTAQEFIYSNFVPATGSVIRAHLNEFTQNSAKLTVWGTPLLVITSLMLMASIEQVFNDIWHIKQNRKILYRFLSYWAILTLAPLLIAGSFSISSYVVALTVKNGQEVITDFYLVFLRLLPWLLELGVFMLLYIVVPNKPINWRHALAAAAVAMVLFEVAKYGFTYFVVHFSNYQLLYGAVAALPVFLVWLYIAWSIVLFGAVITAAIPEWREHIDTAGDNGTTG